MKQVHSFFLRSLLANFSFLSFSSFLCFLFSFTIFKAVLALPSYAQIEKVDAQIGQFNAYVVNSNKMAGLLRIEVNFLNSKYLNIQDMVEIVSSANNKLRCRTFIVGKTQNQILLKISDSSTCSSVASLSRGAYLSFYSQDLVNNLTMGGELLNILIKKRLAIHGMMMRKRGEVDGHMNKIEAINERYRLLRDKLEQEWREEVLTIDKDKEPGEKELAGLERELLDIDKKIEEYRLSDRNLELDRWSLDANRYYLK